MPASSSAARSAAASTRCSPRSSRGGRTEPRPCERLARALDATVVLGLVTNLRFLRWLVRQPVVLDGAGTDRHARPDLAARRLDGDDRDPGGRLGGGRARRSSPTRTPATRGQAAGGSTRRGPCGSRRTATTRTRRRRRAAEPDPAFASVRAGDTVHLDLAGRSVAVPARRGPRRRRGRPRRDQPRSGRRDRSGRGRRPDAGRRPRPSTSRPGRRSRPATRSSPSRR